MSCYCAVGWVCEAHPVQPWPHDDCTGPGEQCHNPECPWWQGVSPAALSTDKWDRLYASTAAGRAMFRVVQPWGPDKARQATVISEHSTAADAFREIDRLSSEMVRTGAPSDAVELVVVDPKGAIVTRGDAH